MRALASSRALRRWAARTSLGSSCCLNSTRTDITLFNGFLKVLLDEDLVDRRYLTEHTEGFEELAVHVQCYDLARVAAECGVEAAAVVRAARAIGRAKRA